MKRVRIVSKRVGAGGGRESVLLDLIDQIYAAAEDPTRWNLCLDRLGEVFRARVVGLVFEDLRLQRARMAAIIGLDAALTRDYEQYYAARNAWMSPAVAKFDTGEVLRSQMVLPDRELVRTEYYNDFLRKLDVRHLMGTPLFREENVLSQLSLLRAHAVGEFSAEESRLFHVLVPHLQRALQLHRRLVALKSEYEQVTDALDCVEVGLLLFDNKGKAFFVNRSAREMLAARDGLTLANEGLRTGIPEETAALRKLVSEAVQTGSGKGSGSGGACSVSRPSMLRPYSLFVTPLRAKQPLLGERSTAAVFVSDPERKLAAQPEVLSRLYGFTRAESRLATRLLQGESVEEAAGGLGITLNTARTHVRHLFEKTDTHRHRELLRILLSGVAMIRTA